MKGLLVLSLSLLVYIQGTFAQDSSLSLAIDALPHCAVCIAAPSATQQLTKKL